MDLQGTPTRARTQIQALVRLYQALAGTAIGLAAISLDGLDQRWRDQVQRIRALPREAPRRKQMIEALVSEIERTLGQQQATIQALQSSDPALAAEARAIARRGEAGTMEQSSMTEPSAGS